MVVNCFSEYGIHLMEEATYVRSDVLLDLTVRGDIDFQGIF